MLVREAKLLNGTQEQYQALDEAIRTAQFIRNKCVRHWMDNQEVGKPGLYVNSKDLAKEFEFAKKLNSTARQASAERAWASISSFYSRCRKGDKKKVILHLKNIVVPLSTNNLAGGYLKLVSKSHSPMDLKLERSLYSVTEKQGKTYTDQRSIV